MTVTFETAQKLKDAGFIPDQPKANQIWYGLIQRQDEQLVLLEVLENFSNKYAVDRYGNHHSFGSIEEFGTFAPTATNILYALGQKFVLWFDDSPKVLKWFCCKTGDTIDDVGKPFADDNPAEACAKAYLAYFSIQIL